jgi:ubiquinone/menaquinone biosynthesis C-methylase UbiE
MRVFARWQRLAVEQLGLRHGQCVIDVACGTGLNLPRLEGQVGFGGKLIGFDLSAEMLAQARQRAASHGWENVILLHAPAEQVEIDASADAALFSFTHDVLQSPAAVANVVAHLKPGARVASVGVKLGARWNLPVNAFVRRSARLYMTTFHGLDRPWRELESYVTDLHVRSLAFGGAYVLSARVQNHASPISRAG